MGGSEAPGGADGLLRAASAGEEWALTILYRRHQPSLLRFLAALASTEAEDLASETWIALARALPRFRGDERALRRLLFTIGRRRAVDHFRAQGRQPLSLVSPHRLPQRPAAVDVGQEFEASDSAAAAARRIGQLLPPEQAEVVLLRVVAGLSVPEVASVVGRSRAAVSVLQTRGLQRLARYLGDGTGELVPTLEIGMAGTDGDFLQDRPSSGRLSR